MISTLRKIFLFFICVLGAIPAGARVVDAEASLDSLDEYVARQEYFLKSKIDELENYKKRMNSVSPEQKLPMIEYLITEYRHVNIDSTLHYSDVGTRLAKQLGNSKYQERFEFLYCTVLPVYGIVKEAVDRFESVDVSSIQPENKRLYYEAGDLIYNYARDFYPIEEYRSIYREKTDRVADSLLCYIPKDDFEYEFHKVMRSLDSGGGQGSISELENLLDRIPFNDRLYARISGIIGNIYVHDPYHTKEAIYYLARSAMSDIVTGNLETTSLHRLGKLLYDKGDVDRSYNYLIMSLSIAVSSGSRLRSLEIAEALPLVYDAIKERDHRSRQLFIFIIIVLSVLLLVLVVLFFIYDRNRRRLKRMKEHLSESNELKDSYIRQILLLCGVYLTALDNFNHLAGRKIKAGQVQDLLNMIESGKILRDQLQTFYDVFDSAFLMVYPNFISEVNTLLQPDKQVVIKEGERMSPELRILAFMRLGLDDSTQISKFLGLSLNTVYTYRNKMKTRALDRETFEEKIRNIGSIE